MTNKGSTIRGLKIIFRYLGEYKKELITLSILGVISAIANGVMPYLAGRLFDAILNPSRVFHGTEIEMPLWVFFILAWLLVRIVSDVVDWRNNLKSDWLQEDIWNSYIIKGISRLLELPISFHKNHKMGEIQEKLNRSGNALSVVSGQVIIDLAPQFLSILVAFVVSFYINFFLAGIMTLGLFIYVFILVRVAPSTVGYHRKMHKAYNKAFGNAYDAVFNVQTIKQAITEKHEQKKVFKDFKLKAMKWWLKLTSVWQGLTFYQRIIITSTQLVIFVISIMFIQRGEMTIGELVMFNGYILMLFGPFVILGRNWQSIQNGITALEQSEKILSLPTERYEPKNSITLSDIRGRIEFQDIYFSYKRGQSVLKGVSFRVVPGEVVALVGESGVGKSTLIDLISGYYFPQRGKILIDGHNIKNLNLSFLRSKIAVVPQEVVLFNDTIRTNIAYGSFGASNEEIEKAARQAHCLEFIEKFPKKWRQLVGERGIKLSVGQKQRVAIARAILQNPRILILDEPTSALDAKSEKFLRESLEKLMKGKTIFIIAHRLSTVRKADKIFVLEQGKIVEQGKHDELIKIQDGIYRNLYELQIGFK